MRKLIMVLLLTLAFTASIHAGEMGQPIAPPPPPPTVTAQGDMPGGITDIALTILGAMLSLI